MEANHMLGALWWWLYSLYLPIVIVRAWRRSCRAPSSPPTSAFAYRAPPLHLRTPALIVTAPVRFGLEWCPGALFPLVIPGYLAASWVPDVFYQPAWVQVGAAVYSLAWFAFIPCTLAAAVVTRQARNACRRGELDASRLSLTAATTVATGSTLFLGLCGVVATLKPWLLDGLFGAPLALAISIALLSLGRACVRLARSADGARPEPS